MSFLFHASFSKGTLLSVSYNTVEWSKCLKSNYLALPSAPTEANKFLSEEKLISYTSLSWAINYVKTVSFSISHMVHVVSIEAVPIRCKFSIFQSNEVNGAENSF